MANWAEGVLRIRGKQSDILRFMTDGLKGDKHTITVEKHADCVEVYGSGDFWIEGTSRGFVDSPYIYMEPVGDNEQCSVAVEACFAWQVRAEELAKISYKYHLDFRIMSAERGMEFTQNIEILKGDITRDEWYEYGDWTWDSPCPLAGG